MATILSNRRSPRLQGPLLPVGVSRGFSNPVVDVTGYSSNSLNRRADINSQKIASTVPSSREKLIRQLGLFWCLCVVLCFFMVPSLKDESARDASASIFSGGTSSFFLQERRKPDSSRVFLLETLTNQTADRSTVRRMGVSTHKLHTIIPNETKSSSKQLYVVKPNISLKRRTIKHYRKVTPMISLKRTAEIADSEEYEISSTDTALETEKCRAQYSWQKDPKPNCNLVHEYGMNQMLKIVGSGYYRDVWTTLGKMEQEAVLKTQRFEHGFSERNNIDRSQRDALAMEHFTASPWILDVYAYCATSSIAEFAPNGSIEDKIWPAGESDDGGSSANNTKISMEFLRLAVQATMGVADLHNYDMDGRPSVAHTDISPSQFVLTRNGRVKLNDFNRARFLRADRETNEVCPYLFEYNRGTNRSPEEYRYKPQTEKVDIYSLGNIFYMLMSRNWPFEDADTKESIKFVKKGGRPSLPPEIRKSKNPIHLILMEAMEMCHVQDPKKRATAREVELFFKKKVNEFAPRKLEEWGIGGRVI
ncbi:hypothetical protein ACA910_003005 [Epithemia clementina (nom. ined.)]